MATDGQLSDASGTVSPSESPATGAQSLLFAFCGHGSQWSPTPSPSVSSCLPLSIGRGALKTVGQRSTSFFRPSPSVSSADGTPVNSFGREGTHVGSSVGVPQK